jgi:hypothetical protein
VLKAQTHTSRSVKSSGRETMESMLSNGDNDSHNEIHDSYYIQSSAGMAAIAAAEESEKSTPKLNLGESPISQTG